MSSDNIYKKRAKIAAEGLMEKYNHNTGFFGPEIGWDSAVALEAMINYWEGMGVGDTKNIIKNTYDLAIQPLFDFINPFYDDSGWWAIFWMRAHDFAFKNGEKENASNYLAISISIFENKLVKGWDDFTGGGIYWLSSPKNHYKAAIQNELFLVVCTRLFQRSDDKKAKEEYLKYADLTWEWLRTKGLIGQNHLVRNGFYPETGDNDTPFSIYRPSDLAIWTYNQGVILGGLVDLFQIKNDPDLLATAQYIANATINTLHYSNSSILKEACEDTTNDERTKTGDLVDSSPLSTSCSGDGKCFKGIFMRYLSYLHKHIPKFDQSGNITPNWKKYKNFIMRNADSVWEFGKGQNSNKFSTRWVGPFNASEVSNGTQMSALDALNAAIPFGE